MQAHENENYDVFRDYLFASIAEKNAGQSKKSTTKKRAYSGRKAPKDIDKSIQQKSPESGKVINENEDPSEMADFSDYLAGEIFSSLPSELQDLSYHALQQDEALSERWSLPLTLGTFEDLSAQIPPSVTDSLISYGLIKPPETDVQSFISGIITTYISSVSAPPPKWGETRTSACEICDREWVPLTYHHLIPKAVHTKVLKRGWHEEHQLNRVAWLCRACHSFVHKMASNEELAKEYYTVEKICEREDVQKWAQWIGRVRWKKK